MSVFLSHSSKDKDFVRRLANDLAQDGIRVWIDEGELRAGDSLTDIQTAIRKSDCFVVVLSTAALESGWVEKEIQLAKNADGIRIVPVLLEDVTGEWTIDLTHCSHVDFRRRSDYWRGFHKLLSAIRNLPNPVLLNAKQAATKIKQEAGPSGELFGLSQQGIATMYSLRTQWRWNFGDATTGESRLWIGEFYDASTASVQPYALSDGRIHQLPQLFLLDSDPHPVKNSRVVYSCALNDVFEITEQAAQTLQERFPDRFEKIEKRYTRFRPVPISSPYVDSTEAVFQATKHADSKAVLGDRREDVFTLTKLEWDKHDGLPIWKVSFFDPSLTESVLTVGVDAKSGKVKYPSMQTELLNVDFLHISEEDDGQIKISVAGLSKVWIKRDWDITLPWECPQKYRTARDAIRMAERFLGENEPRPWQLAFLSNTGVIESVVAPGIAGPEDCLLRRDGTAGQWVIEVCGMEPRLVSRETGSEIGYEYDYKRLLVTQSGVSVAIDSPETCTFTVPLSQCPLPKDILEGYEKALALALRSATFPFCMMSVAIDRPRGGAQWRFRFYGSKEILLVVRVAGDGSRVLT